MQSNNRDTSAGMCVFSGPLPAGVVCRGDSSDLSPQSSIQVGLITGAYTTVSVHIQRWCHKLWAKRDTTSIVKCHMKYMRFRYIKETTEVQLKENDWGS